MSVPPIISYPLDLTGTSPTNLIEGVVKEVYANNERAFVAVAGPFYTESFRLYNDETGALLKPNDDYILVQPHQQAAMRSGKDVQSAIVLKTSTPIRVSYSCQVVGGEYSWNLQALAELIDELNLDERPVKWGDIIGRPHAYPPAPHMHDIGDTYGWEYVTWQLEKIAQSILVGDEASHDELREQILHVQGILQGNIDELDGELTSHINDKSNPHHTTKAHVGLGNVENFPVATPAEALAGTRADRYMTPAGTATLADRIADEAVATHEARKDNPHAVTKAQVGLGSVSNFPTASNAQAISQTHAASFMTPQRTYEAIRAHVGTTIDAHIANKNNPHEVTKAQVGLGSVENYPLATRDEARTGTANNRYMTPLRTKEAIAVHIEDKNNPHGVTKVQVGLGSVENYPVSTKAEAEGGTAANRYMTPLRTKEAIDFQVGNAYRAHAAARNNPHAVTKAQVGLGSVDNYSTATKAEAEAGSANNRFMTPLRTKEAIEAIGGALINAHANNKNNPHAVTKAQVGLSNIPNEVSRSRTLNSSNSLLLAGAMFDHNNSGDHDSRYVRLGAPTNCSMRVLSGKLQAYVNGRWQQIWPATWTGHVAPGATDNEAGNAQDIQLMVAGGILYASVDGVYRQIWPASWAD